MVLGRQLLGDAQVGLFLQQLPRHVAGEPRRVVFQGVHMMFDGRPDRPWEAGEDRTNRIVFIGRNLPEAELRSALRACVVPA